MTDSPPAPGKEKDTSVKRPILKYFFAAVLIILIFLPQSRADSDDDQFLLEEQDDFRSLSESLIDIQVVGRKVLAIQKGETVLARELDLDEGILFRGTQGRMGLVMTNRRLLVVSTFTSDWVELPLRIEEVAEGKAPKVLLSDFLVMVVTRQRLLGFDSQRNVWVKAGIPVNEIVAKALIDKRVAVAITGTTAWGFAFGSAFFVPERFQLGENVLQVETRPLNVNIRTNKRLLVFKSVTATWKAFDAGTTGGY